MSEHAWRLAQAELSIARFERALSRFGDRLTARLFVAEERAYCAERRHAAQHFAVRFAAKRAARHLLGVGGPHDVVVGRDAAGAPSLRLSGAAARAAAGRTLQLALSHDADAAVALVALGPPAAEALALGPTQEAR